jgi:signal peptidase I
LPVRTIERGEIVALWSPENPKMRLIKRVIGLPGETIEIRNRDVYINGKSSMNLTSSTTTHKSSPGATIFRPLSSRPTGFSSWAIIVTTVMTAASGVRAEN